jgi:hypothetical protein
MFLTDTALRAVKPSDKAQKLFDGNGLFFGSCLAKQPIISYNAAKKVVVT